MVVVVVDVELDVVGGGGGGGGGAAVVGGVVGTLAGGGAPVFPAANGAGTCGPFST